MGVSDYIFVYETEEEKERLNALIERYKINYSKIIELDKNYVKFRDIVYSSYGNDEENDEENDEMKYDETKDDEEIMKMYPDINFEGIDIKNVTIKKEYIANCLILNNYHSNIKLSNGSDAIRVFFSMGATSDFSEYLENHGFSSFMNPYSIEYTEIEEYPNEYEYLNEEQSYDIY